MGLAVIGDNSAVNGFERISLPDPAHAMAVERDVVGRKLAAVWKSPDWT